MGQLFTTQPDPTDHMLDPINSTHCESKLFWPNATHGCTYQRCLCAEAIRKTVLHRQTSTLLYSATVPRRTYRKILISHCPVATKQLHSLITRQFLAHEIGSNPVHLTRKRRNHIQPETVCVFTLPMSVCRLGCTCWCWVQSSTDRPRHTVHRQSDWLVRIRAVLYRTLYKWEKNRNAN